MIADFCLKTDTRNRIINPGGYLGRFIRTAYDYDDMMTYISVIKSDIRYDTVIERVEWRVESQEMDGHWEVQFTRSVTKDQTEDDRIAMVQRERMMLTLTGSPYTIQEIMTDAMRPFPDSSS